MTIIIQKIYTLLKYVFVVVLIVAGLDKFTNILTDCSQYLNPIMTDMLSGHHRPYRANSKPTSVLIK